MRIRRAGLWLLIIGCLSGCTDRLAAQPTGGKPSAPVTLTLATEEPAQAGELATVVVSATARVDSRAFHLHVELPESVSLFSGDSDWSGPVTDGSHRILRLVIRVPESGRHVIRATATIEVGGHPLSVQRTLAVGTGPMTQGNKPESRETMRNGRRIREYELP